LSDEVLDICLEQGADCLHVVKPSIQKHIVSCLIKIQNSFTSLVLAYQDRPGKEAVKLVLLLLSS